MTQGHQLFVDGLTPVAAEIGDPRLAAIAASVVAPLRIAVSGRRGVGRRTVAQALDAAGLSVVAGSDPDVAVHVVAETVKPEDTRAVRDAAALHPVLVVLNKADLPGRCAVADVARLTRAPAEAMSGLFALAARDDRLDDGLWATLGRLAADPTGLTRVERERLCAVLDLSGIERIAPLARRGGTAGQARAVLRGLSGVDRVVARLATVGAGVYHRRMTTAVARLEALAVGGDPTGRIDEFLTGDATVAARMAAAAAVVGERCMPGEPALGRASRWQAYRGAPLGATGRACAGDLARGALRAWAVTRGRP